jgi:hypothetical protein
MDTDPVIRIGILSIRRLKQPRPRRVTVVDSTYALLRKQRSVADHRCPARVDRRWASSPGGKHISTWCTITAPLLAPLAAGGVSSRLARHQPSRSCRVTDTPSTHIGDIVMPSG